MTTDELRRYAEMIVRGCIAFRRGDTLLVRAGAGSSRAGGCDPGGRVPRRRAAAVEVEYEDGRVYAARIRHASEKALGRRTSWQRERMRALAHEHVAIVQMTGEHELDVVAGLPPERVAEDSKRLAADAAMARIRGEGRLRGTICAWPTDEWAARVFPGLDPERAKRQLAKDLLSFCRVGPKDPPGAQGLDGAPRDAAPAGGPADEARPGRACTSATAAPTCASKIAPYSMWRGGGEQDQLGPADRDERPDRGVLHLAGCARRPRGRSAARARAASAAA